MEGCFNRRVSTADGCNIEGTDVCVPSDGVVAASSSANVLLMSFSLWTAIPACRADVLAMCTTVLQLAQTALLPSWSATARGSGDDLQRQPWSTIIRVLQCATGVVL